jgi:hypothetical protein
MKIAEIKTIAKQRNIKTGKVTKTELVRAIQLDEGNSPCFDTKTSQICGQDDCLWRGHCD